MARWKRILRTMLFPNTILTFLLFNASLCLLLYVFCVSNRPEPMAYVSYVISAYTLTVVCMQVPRAMKRVRRLLYDNKYSNRYLTEKELRMRVSLYSGLALNICFALFKVVMGILYESKWLFAMAGYNTILSCMRFILIHQDRANNNKLNDHERILHGLHSYRICGWLMLLLNVTISVIVVMVVFWNHTIDYPGFMIYAMAAFTFYCLTMATIHMVKYWHIQNPIFSAVKRVEMAKALVSIFTLQVAMITQFGTDDGIDYRYAHGATGFVVCLAITAIAILMIRDAKKDYKDMKINIS